MRNFRLIFQLESVKTYHNQSEVIDDVLDNAFQCMQELDISVGK